MHPIITGSLATVIFGGGLVWQGWTFMKDGENEGKRHLVAGVLSVIVVLGAVGYTILAFFDSNVNLGFGKSIALIGTAALVGVLFFTKQAFGPLLLSTSLAWGTYTLCQHGTFDVIPLLKGLIEYLFSQTPGWVGTAYMWVVGIYSLVGSLYSSCEIDLS